MSMAASALHGMHSRCTGCDVADNAELVLCRGQVVRHLQRGILEELRQLQEPGNDSHICYQTLQKPLVRVSLKVCACTAEGSPC